MPGINSSIPSPSIKSPRRTRKTATKPALVATQFTAHEIALVHNFRLLPDELQQCIWTVLNEKADERRVHSVRSKPALHLIAGGK